MKEYTKPEIEEVRFETEVITMEGEEVYTSIPDPRTV